MKRLPPPAGRFHRQGFARRDNNLALFRAIATGMVLAIAIILLTLQRLDPGRFGMLRNTLVDALAPAASMARAPFDTAGRIGHNIGAVWHAVGRNHELERELRTLRRDARELRQLRSEAAHMRALLNMRTPERVVVASGVASTVSPSGARRSAIVTAGYADGVRPRMPAIAPGGLAGRVIEVGRSASRIMLLSDNMSRVPVIVERTGWSGLATGTGGGIDFVFDIASERDRLKDGDLLVTSGDGGLFPPGIPVGRIVNARRNPPTVRASANPQSLGMVAIEKAWIPPFVPLSEESPDLADTRADQSAQQPGNGGT